VSAIAAERDEEKAIVDRVWKALGVTTYADAKGKAIDELVSELKAERDALAGRVAELEAVITFALENGDNYEAEKRCRAALAKGGKGGS
jgi:hypothetical protein